MLTEALAEEELPEEYELTDATVDLGALAIADVAAAQAEAQAIVDAEVTAAQTAWDALPEDQKGEDNPRPADITLTE